ncbi:MAG: 4Fe-4S binding protein [Calditrichaeota bacterium]|nr:4Fe-4S binding protein [Calditrichota bacterium]
MMFVRLLPVIFSCLLMAAHFSRGGILGLAIFWLFLPFLLFVKRQWVVRVFQVLLVFAMIIWVETAIRLIQMRQAMGESWTRLAIILAVVALFSGLSALVFENKKVKDRFKKKKIDGGVVASILLTAGLLAIVQIKVANPMLLAERFFPSLGWLEIAVLALYAGFLVEKMFDPQEQQKWRLRIWLFFSVVFFGQLLIGLLGAEKFLMTGKLHLPIPAMIVAGPIFRGSGFFMPILFLTTILLVGPAWCSHLCYIGAWDNFASNGARKPAILPRWRHAARLGILLMIVAVSLLLRLAGVDSFYATILGAAFGLLGVGIMGILSRKKGSMIHCTVYCPIGLLANALGKINPFRIRINDSCTECGACTRVCRYQALSMNDVKNRKPSFTCTLCGDCVGSCHENSIEYRFGKIEANRARIIFLVIIVSLHAVFLGVARI